MSESNDCEMKDHNESCHPVYISRRTILDRPCWRDDSVTLRNVDSKYEVRILACRKGGRGGQNEEMIYDTFKVGPMRQIKNQFTEKSETQLTLQAE